MTDRQWEKIEPMLPPAKPGGRPRSLDMRQVINAILYIVVGGIQWRMLPKEYPKWQSVYIKRNEIHYSLKKKLIISALFARIKASSGNCNEFRKFSPARRFRAESFVAFMFCPTGNEGS